MPAPPPDSAPEVVDVLGVRFHNLSRKEAARAVAALAGAATQACVVKPYSEFMPRAVRDLRVREILNGAALCLPDGAGIVWAAHYLALPGGRLRALLQLPLSLAALVLNPRAVRRPLKQAMAGVDFTWEMLSALAEAGAGVFLLGGREEEVAGTVARVRQRLPALRIAGWRHGHFRLSGAESEAVIALVNQARPQVLLVAMGFPRQEIWIADNLRRLDVKVAVAEGGSFSFISGATPRAPRWLRRSGLEWLYRLLRQPWRLRRQLALPVFVWLVLRQRLRAGR
ncbi:MAG: WecB/TagA/CpsF family glycosyltransferase [Dehalococcoidia bacterium]|nr:WecB/TagA/CpsF family glycosyltransferase [Dehalococcoidia bacterium]